MRGAKLPYTAWAEVDHRALARNLDLLCGIAEKNYEDFDGAVPMVKAEAYGHGLEAVAKKLANHRRTVALGVATPAEGARLRDAGVRAPIWVFSRVAVHASAMYRALRLVPVLGTIEELKYWLSKNASSPYQLKLNTGMNRIGIDVMDWQKARALIRAKDRGGFEGVCSHFAQPSSRQAEAFKAGVAVFAAMAPSHIHMANTGGILKEKELGLGRVCTLVRPGIGLYGYAGRAGERIGLKPALELFATSLKSRALKPGEHVGYDGTYTASKKTHVSILGIGYGDGFHRALSNQIIPAGRVAGRISMDTFAIEGDIQPGKSVCLLGRNAEQGENLAKAAGTITYELLTSIAPRVPRIYHG